MRVSRITSGALPAALMTTSVLVSVRAAVAQELASAQPPSSATLATVIVTAEKRPENAQTVPMSIQALPSKQLTELIVNNFRDYANYVPSMSFQSHQGLNGGSAGDLIYMRGVAEGSTSAGGSLPLVATYLDEQPVTSIAGTLDVHMYDVSRVEVLPGPQGTLYGASSEAGTLRIITNKPELHRFYGSVDLQGDSVGHGGNGYVDQGFVNIPVGDRAAIRLVAFDEYDPGFIDNVPATRTFATSGATVNNSNFVHSAFNGSHQYGGRAALEVDLNDRWTVTPSVITQETRATGINAYEPAVGYLDVERFGPDYQRDRWWQAALTIQGKVGDFDLTYAGAYLDRRTHSATDYMDYSVFYDNLYGSGAAWTDDLGNVISDPHQEVYATDKYTNYSNELRIASPSTDRLRFVAGLFQQTQTANSLWPYTIDDYATANSVVGFPSTIFLIDQNRVERDLAAFGEATYDITSKLSFLAGVRLYQDRNNFEGYYGYRTAPPGSPGSLCVTSGLFDGAPCATFDKDTRDSGETHKFTLSYKLAQDRLIYATYATGYRPGGTNRNPGIGPYKADSLSSYEIGWKTEWLGDRLIWNTAVYREIWDDFQFTFEGPNGTSIYQNAPSAAVTGVETSVHWLATERLQLTGAVSFNDSSISRDFCGVSSGSYSPIRDCAGLPIQVTKGTPLVYVPRFKGDITARYSFPVPRLGDWIAHVEATAAYRGSIPLYLRVTDIQDAGRYYRLGGYATESLSAGISNGSQRVEVFAKNLFDSHGAVNAQTSCAVSTCGSTAIAGVPQAFYVTPAQPRTIGVEFSQDF